MKTGYKNIKHF